MNPSTFPISSHLLSTTVPWLNTTSSISQKRKRTPQDTISDNHRSKKRFKVVSSSPPFFQNPITTASIKEGSKVIFSSPSLPLTSFLKNTTICEKESNISHLPSPPPSPIQEYPSPVLSPRSPESLSPPSSPPCFVFPNEFCDDVLKHNFLISSFLTFVLKNDIVTWDEDSYGYHSPYSQYAFSPSRDSLSPIWPRSLSNSPSSSPPCSPIRSSRVIAESREIMDRLAKIDGEQALPSLPPFETKWEEDMMKMVEHGKQMLQKWNAQDAAKKAKAKEIRQRKRREEQEKREKEIAERLKKQQEVEIKRQQEAQKRRKEQKKEIKARKRREAKFALRGHGDAYHRLQARISRASAQRQQESEIAKKLKEKKKRERERERFQPLYYEYDSFFEHSDTDTLQFPSFFVPPGQSDFDSSCSAMEFKKHKEAIKKDREEREKRERETAEKLRKQEEAEIARQEEEERIDREEAEMFSKTLAQIDDGFHVPNLTSQLFQHQIFGVEWMLARERTVKIFHCYLFFLILFSRIGGLVVDFCVMKWGLEKRYRSFLSSWLIVRI